MKLKTDEPRYERWRWTLPVIAVSIASVTRYALHPWIGQTMPFALFFLSVAVSAFYGSFGHGMVAALLSALSVSWFFPVLPSETMNEHGTLAVFFLVSLAISILAHRIQKAHRMTSVSARKRAEEQVEAERRRLENVLETIPVAVVIVEGPEGKLSYANRRAKNLYGFDSVGLTKDENVARVKPKRPTSSACPVSELPAYHALMGEHVWDQEMILERVDGTSHAVSGTASPILDAQGKPVAAVIALEDIGERRRVEDSLRRSEEQFRAIFESSSDCILVWDREYNYLYANQAAIDHVHTTRDRVIGKNIRDGLGHIPDFMHLWMMRVDRAFLTGEPFRVEDAVPVDERLVYSESQVSPIRDAVGHIFAVGVVYRDVTDRKQVEEALRESEERYRGTFENAAVGITHTDAQGRWLRVNQKLSDILGYSGKDLQKMSFRHVSHADDLTEDWEKYQAMWRGELDSYHVEKRYLRKGGTYVWLDIHRAIQRASAGQPLYSINILEDITARKQAEESLARQHLLYESILTNTPDLAYIFDLNHRFIYANEGLLRMWGKSRDEAIGKNFLELGYEAWHAEMHDREIEQVIATKKPIRGVVPFSGTFGRRIYDYIFVPVFSADGEVEAVAGTTRDVTDARQTEHALRESEERFRLVLEASQVGWWHWDFETDTLDGDAKVKALLGLAPDTPLSFERILEQVDPDDRDAFQRRALELQTKSGEYEVDFRACWPTGECHWLLAKGRSFNNGSTKPIRAMGIVLDIDDRKRIEEALRQSESFYRQTLESIPGMVFTTQPDGYCDYQSQQWVDYSGIPMSEHLGDGWNRLLHPEDRARALAAWHAAVEENAPYDLEYRIRRYDGQHEWFKVIGRPLRDSDGRIARWFGVAINIEDLKRAEQELQHANAAKDQFLATLSHELRTPLTPILAAVQLLQRTEELSEKAQAYMQLIRRNLELEVRLIDDLLDLTRVVSGKILLEKVSVNICEILEHVAQVCKPDIEARRLHFGVKLEKPPYSIYADASRLQQVFWNLVKNSIKFTPEGGCIGIFAFEKDGNVIVEVSDSGIGIEQQHLPKIFDAFEQGGQRVTRQFGGLGLGLAITKRLVEMHGGTISARSEGKGQGAAFCVVLPLIGKSQKETETETESSTVYSSMQILLVEDHGDTAQMTRALLEALGHRVEIAGDVAEALKAANEKDFDLLISDLGLPDKSGLELMQELRKSRKQVKGIALSGFGREEDVKRSKAAGFSEHLTKPVDLNTLRRVMEKVAA